MATRPRPSAMMPLRSSTSASTDAAGTDRWSQRDTAPYTAIKGLAATLSLEKMARHTGDDATTARCRERFERGSAQLERLLWNGDYYRLWADQGSGEVDEGCLLAQVCGAWDGQSLDLEPVIPRDRLESELRSIVRLTGGHSPFGLVLAGNPDRSPVYANDLPPYPGDSLRCDFAPDVWPSYDFILAAICAHRALSADEGMHAAHRVIDNLFHGANNMPWGWPCNVHAYTGGSGMGTTTTIPRPSGPYHWHSTARTWRRALGRAAWSAISSPRARLREGTHRARAAGGEGTEHAGGARGGRAPQHGCVTFGSRGGSGGAACVA